MQLKWDTKNREILVLEVPSLRIKAIRIWLPEVAVLSDQQHHHALIDQ